MKPTVLLTKKATRAALLSGMRSAAKSLKAGDLFFMTYSGHGGQVRDSNGDEPDRKDETWCLYDGQLIDDELYFELSRFAAGDTLELDKMTTAAIERGIRASKRLFERSDGGFARCVRVETPDGRSARQAITDSILYR